MSRIVSKFQELNEEEKIAFIPYICYGYPNIKTSEKLVIELSKCGANIIEIGFPFSDPLADGPTIQHASHKALKNEISLDIYLNSIKKIRKNVDIPLVIMSYYNPIFRYGEERFVKNSLKSGLDGAIIPDLPIEEADSLMEVSYRTGFDLIQIISPTTPKERMKHIADKSLGFIYYVSLTGVTGARSKLPSTIKSHVEILKSLTNKPVCVGFGISKPSHVKEVANIADGVIVGSAIINAIDKNLKRKDLDKKVSNFVKKLIEFIR